MSNERVLAAAILRQAVKDGDDRFLESEWADALSDYTGHDIRHVRNVDNEPLTDSLKRDTYAGTFREIAKLKGRYTITELSKFSGLSYNSTKSYAYKYGVRIRHLSPEEKHEIYRRSRLESLGVRFADGRE